MPIPDDPGAGDFDFIIGAWRVHHRRLDARLCACNEWTEFEGRSVTRKILGGNGNVEDNLLAFPDGEVRAAAFRSFDPGSRRWSIWWLDGRHPHRLDTPVVGSFVQGTGSFFCDDMLDGKPVRVRFIWKSNPGGNPSWEQAFSDDGGVTWETNWTMVFHRDEAGQR